jgi:enamine deaminase RidA (YjgF/YER057c/UK114 family)
MPLPAPFDRLRLPLIGSPLFIVSGPELVIAQCKAAVGELSNIRRVVKLGGFVNAAPGFVDIPQVINGCSDLMVEVFGEAGKHARAAVACPTLPLGVAVEVDGVFEIA